MTETAAAAPPSHWQRYRMLYLLAAVCIAPALASYVAYYWMPPEGRTNYGTLVQPQRPLPALTMHRLDGSRVEAAELRGRWLMLQVDSGDCAAACAGKLWTMRQLRLAQGKDAERIERLWLLVDEAPPAEALLREHQGTQILRARSDQLLDFLALPQQPGAQLTDHIWLVDPQGNLMLRWPKDGDASRMKKDFAKLLKASRIG